MALILLIAPAEPTAPVSPHFALSLNDQLTVLSPFLVVQQIHRDHVDRATSQVQIGFQLRVRGVQEIAQHRRSKRKQVRSTGTGTASGPGRHRIMERKYRSSFELDGISEFSE